MTYKCENGQNDRHGHSSVNALISLFTVNSYHPDILHCKPICLHCCYFERTHLESGVLSVSNRVQDGNNTGQSRLAVFSRKPNYHKVVKC